MKSNKRGFTLIELLIVTAILGVLMILGAVTFSLQRQRGLDARRKSDFAKLKVVFEDYYNDKGCYPTAVMMSHCGLNDLAPYLPKVPCDPLSGKPYAYTVDAACKYYGLMTTLQDVNDPIIKTLNCSPTCLGGKTYNYGLTNAGLSLSQIAAQVQ